MSLFFQIQNSHAQNERMAESTQWTQKEVLMLLHKLNLQEEQQTRSTSPQGPQITSSKKVYFLFLFL